MTEKHYRCVKEFYVPLCDDDGYEVESGEMVPVEVGETFYRHPIPWMSDIRLEGVDNYSWLEITREQFDECFEEVK